MKIKELEEMKEKAIEYFKFHRKIFCEDHLKILPEDSIAYQATLKEKEFYDMAIKALETVEEFEKAQIITGGRLNGRTYAYKCGLEDGRRKALEQEPVLDKVRNEIAECGSIWVAYAITGHSDRDIENLIEDVVKQAKEQVLDIIDKYRIESEVQNEV